MALPPKAWIATFLPTALISIFGLLYFRRMRAHDKALSALKQLIEGINLSDSFSVRPLTNEAELRELWEIDMESYGEASINLDTFRSWWRAYPRGVYVLFEGCTIVGAIGVWPLKRTPYIDLVEGKRRERELTHRSISRNGSSLRHWYVSGIVLMKKYRKTNAVRILLLESLKNWLDIIQMESNLNICALAYSQDGELMLRRFGFHKYKNADETVDKYPIYALMNTSIREFKKVVGRVVPEIDESEGGRA